jgi:hypothetical protein
MRPRTKELYESMAQRMGTSTGKRHTDRGYQTNDTTKIHQLEVFNAVLACILLSMSLFDSTIYSTFGLVM